MMANPLKLGHILRGGVFGPVGGDISTFVDP